MILAGIDIGTNAIRLLITETTETSHRTLYAARTITRLGQGLDRTGVLAPEAQQRSLEVLQAFRSSIERFSVQAYRVVGTSALRRAANAGDFLREVKARTGFDLEVISGLEEARLTLLGVRRALSHGRAGTEDPLDSSLVIDIGGGSTELIMTSSGAVLAETSLDLGAVYFTERFLRHDPPLREELDRLADTVRKAVMDWDAASLLPLGRRASSVQVLAGTAGTVTTLAAMAQKLTRYHPDLINGYRLSREALDSIIAFLAATPASGRRNVPGLERGREDIILAGAVIAREIMSLCRQDALLVSDWGLREGIVFALYEAG